MGLDVEIQQGGPQVNNRPMLPTGKIDFLMTCNPLQTFDNVKNGIGAMTTARVKDFYDKMVRAGLYKPGDVDLSKAVTTQFVNKKVGLDVKQKLGVK